MMTDSYETFKKNYFQLTGIDLNSYKENQMKRRINTFIKKYHLTTYQDFLSKNIYEISQKGIDNNEL